MKNLHMKGNDSRFQSTVHPFAGVKFILQSVTSSITEQEFWFWHGIDNQSKTRSLRKIYRSEERLVIADLISGHENGTIMNCW